MPVTYGQIKVLRRRADFRELVETVRRGGIEAARAIFLHDLPAYMELHAWAARRAREKDDVRAMAALTTPAIDRVVPKRDDFLLQLNAPTITIMMTEKQRAIEDAHIEVTAVPLPPNASPEDVAPADAPKALAPGSSPADAWAAARAKDALAGPPRPWDD